MSELRAYALRPEYPLEELSGATTVVGEDRQTLDIKAALVEGNGTIVTSSPTVSSALAGYPALEEVELPENAQPTVLNVSLLDHVDPVGPVVQYQDPPNGVQPVPVDPDTVAADQVDPPQGADTPAPSETPQGDDAGPANPPTPARSPRRR